MTPLKPLTPAESAELLKSLAAPTADQAAGIAPDAPSDAGALTAAADRPGLAAATLPPGVFDRPLIGAEYEARRAARRARRARAESPAHCPHCGGALVLLAATAEKA